MIANFTLSARWTAAGTALIAAGSLMVTRAAPQPAPASGSFPVAIRVDAGDAKGPLKQIWRYFGADEPNYAYMEHGSKLIADEGRLARGRVFFRAHNLLTTGDGTPALKWGSTNAYTEDPQGKPIYDWTIVDRIFDTYLKNGVKPYAQIGFMPKALSTKPEPYQHKWTPEAKYDEIYTGWAYPPTDYKKWGDLAYQWVKHSVEKYGRAVGGPDTAGHGGQWMRDFLEHQLRGKNFATGQIGTPIDFLSFHAKGRPTYVDGHVRMGISAQLATIDEGFRIIASYPELKSKPIVIGESDPEGCAACQGPQLKYRNTTMYSSYTAASFARKHDLADRHGVNLEGALTWAFEFEDTPYFAGFRALSTNGINLPVFNVFRMFSRMGAQRVPATSDGAADLETLVKQGVRERPDVAALASRDPRRVTVLAWHYHDDDVPGPAADVSLAIDGLGMKQGKARLQHFRIDADHSNAYTVWMKMGSPAKPSRAQYAELEKASELAAVAGPANVDVSNGSAKLAFSLPRQGVSLLVLEW